MVGKVKLTGERQTLLMTLYGKAMESTGSDSLLRDEMARRAVGMIDYDFASLGVDQNMAKGLAIRASQFDRWVRDFVNHEPQAMVLHLGCGLDTRVFRVDTPPGTLWFEVDYPDVIALREQVYPPRPGERMVGASVTDTDWLDQVPRDLPAIVVAEGLTPYLPPEEGRRLLSRLVAHLHGGELVCDVYSGLGLKMIRSHPGFRSTGAELRWAVEEPGELEDAAPKLRLLDDLPAYRPEHARLMSWPARPLILLWSFVPPFRKVGRMLRFRF